jgi:hypothetical protein
MADPITFDSIDVSMSSQSRVKPSQNRNPMHRSTSLSWGISADGQIGASKPTDRIWTGAVLFKVDRDNDEAVMEKMNVSVRLRQSGMQSPPVDLAFCEMDDFHPDQIYSRTDLFKSLKGIRRRLVDADTFAETAVWLSGAATETRVIPVMPPFGRRMQTNLTLPARRPPACSIRSSMTSSPESGRR